MATYTERVERNLKGCEAVSTGPCPGCDECREAAGYVPMEYEDDEDGSVRWYVKADYPGWDAYGTEDECLAACREAFREEWHAGRVVSEGGFSWSECDICGSRLGGDREVWHYVADGEIVHADGACVDCVQYLANGTVPN